MLDPQGEVSPADVHLQSFSVRYDYPVYFTRGLFDPKNPCLCNAVSGNAVSGKDPADLQPAFAAYRNRKAGGEWRVHCHVPIFLERAGRFDSTQVTLKAALACTRAQFVAPHLEVETYTWNVLPEELRRGSRADAIARELSWVLQELR